ncbi:hypothetical protein HanPSC8_Chr08g0337261 [Helianthus annuus]|nr:hypothetical protein HanPSC8_Chr08g0337261 [Helianthus annuus]
MLSILLLMYMIDTYYVCGTYLEYILCVWNILRVYVTLLEMEGHYSTSIRSN